MPHAESLNATPVVCVRGLDGSVTLLSVSGRLLYAHNAETKQLVHSQTLPHRITAVFPTVGMNNRSSRVYVLIDGPEPLVEVDYVCGGVSPVLDNATQRAYLARWSSDVRLDCILCSNDGSHVAVSHSNGDINVYEVSTLKGSPLFGLLNAWHLGEGVRVYSMVLAGDGDDAIRKFIMALACKPNASRKLIRIDTTNTTWSRGVSIDTNATSISAVPGDTSLVALFDSFSTLSYVNVSTLQETWTHELVDGKTEAHDDEPPYPSTIVALQGGDDTKYAAVVSDYHSMTVFTSDGKTNAQKEYTDACTRVLPVTDTVAAVVGPSQTHLVDLALTMA